MTFDAVVRLWLYSPVGWLICAMTWVLIYWDIAQPTKRRLVGVALAVLIVSTVISAAEISADQCDILKSWNYYLWLLYCGW